jgi:hypothetical protein
MAVKKAESTTINIPVLKQGETTLRIIGRTPLYQNRMSNKVMEYLLVGGKKKTAAEKLKIKHDPLAEFRNSAEMMEAGPTKLGLRATAIKGAMCTAALETPGVTKASAYRLITIDGTLIPLFGIPQLKMDVVRSADMAKTPDVRTRCYLPQWGAEVYIRFITPQFSLNAIVAMLSNAGTIIGVGDFRQEKGKGNFGTFRVIGGEAKDSEWDYLVKEGGRKAQEIAMDSPEYADQETAELMEFYGEEVKRRAV